MKSTSNAPVDICVITTIHRPFDGRIYERGIKSLLEAGLSVCLISPWQKPDHPWLEHQWITLSAPNRRIDRILHGFRTFQAAWKQPALVYHFHDIDFILWAVLLKFFKCVPVVYDCHENYPIEVEHDKAWIPSFLRSFLSRMTRKIENWATKKLGYCIAVVPHQVTRFSKLGVRTVLVRNYANWKPRRDLKHECALICTCGSLRPSYGINILVDISRELKRRNLNIPLIIADIFASDEIKENLKRTIENEQLPIIIFPKYKAKDVDALMTKACIGLAVEQDTPEKRLAIPTKLFEYMAMGLPVIASDLPNTRKIINKANCGILVASDHPRAYVNAAVSLLKNPEEFKAYQENGFKAVETIYSWDSEKKKLIDFFNDLIKIRKLNNRK